MIPLGLSAADKRAFEATLTRSHRIRTIARVHNHNEKIIGSFDGEILSGAVHVDASGTGPPGFQVKDDAIRTLDLTLLQPRKTANWLPDSPGDAGIFANNFVSVEYGVFVDDLSAGPDWVDVPVFWGPITRLEQDGDQVTVRGSGKEVLGLPPVLVWNPFTIRKGTRRVDGVRRILESTGEARFALPKLRDRITNTWSLARHSSPWFRAVAMARHGDRQLFYDGAGRARMRKWPQNRSWLFRDGENGTVLSRPKVAYDISQVRNTVEVLGGNPKGPKKRIRAVARPNPHFPLSPWTLRRNGERRFMVHVEENDVTSQRKANAIAFRLLNQLMTATVEVQLDSLVIPHLEEGDRCAALVDGVHIEFNLQKFTLPLVSGESMSVGFNRRVSWKTRRSSKPAPKKRSGGSSGRFVRSGGSGRFVRSGGSGRWVPSSGQFVRRG